MFLLQELQRHSH